MNDVTDPIGSCRESVGIDRSTAAGAANATSRARIYDNPFVRSARVLTLASVCAIETRCEYVREAAHGVLIGAIPDLGQAV